MMKEEMMGRLEYSLIRSRRKSIAIEIARNGEVLVRAPQRMPESEIQKFVFEKREWILKHQEKMRQSRSEAEVNPLTIEELDQLFEDMQRIIPEKVVRYAQQMGVTFGRITIRNQKTRWGSCSAKGNLNFNCLLMLAPEQVLNYVVIHELAHRKELNHSKRFWEEVAAVMPDYQKPRQWLKDHGDELMQRMLAMEWK